MTVAWFQFTLPHGERRVTTYLRFGEEEFQFTLPHGERHFRQSIMRKTILFQFTLPHGERLDDARNTVARLQVSIHAPAWGATKEEGDEEGDAQFQFTLPHGERRTAGFLGLRHPQVSIHAPAWGATGGCPRFQ